jgi:hypothetical protein
VSVSRRTGCVPAGHVIVGTGGSHVSVAPSVGTRPGGHVSVVGGAQGTAPQGPSTGGVGTVDTGGAGFGAGGAAAGGAGGAGGGGAGGATGGAGGAVGGATGVETTVGGVGWVGVGCSRVGSSDVAADTLTRCAVLSTLSVPSGDVGIPEQPTARTETLTRNVLTRITSTSLPESGGLVSGRSRALHQARAMPSPCGAKITMK